MAHSIQVVFDCANPIKLSKFYAGALHYKPWDPPSGYSSVEAWLKAQGVPEGEWDSAALIVDPEGKGPRIYFQKMDTPKPGKNRLHIDINASRPDLSLEQRKLEVLAEVKRIAELGATKQRELEEMGEYCVVMQDPEYNEFCVQ